MTNFTRDFAVNTMTGSTAFTPNRNLKKLSNALFPLLFLCVFLFGSRASAQQMSNYAFSTATNASLENLNGNGETFLLPMGNYDTQSSAVAPIGFPFYFMGGAYSYFSANSNGQFQLHKTAGESAIPTSTTPGAGFARFGLFGGDNEVNGIKYKVIGTAPNRTLVIEWTQFYVYWTPNLENAGNMQAWLHEGTGVINYVYGEIYNASSSSQTRTIFISGSNTASTIGSINIQTAPTVPTYVTGTTTLFSNSIAGGSGTTTGAPVIANIGSSTQGSRRIFSFNPGTYTGQATNLTFTGVNALGMTLNWADAATDETGFVVDVSTDGGTTWTNLTTTAAGATSYVVTGLTASTNYSWRVAAIR
ncbi:MAG: fibronectin type III domain-containing protein, partial [Sphingobacteriales bacterium]